MFVFYTFSFSSFFPSHLFLPMFCFAFFCFYPFSLFSLFSFFSSSFFSSYALLFLFLCLLFFFCLPFLFSLFSSVITSIIHPSSFSFLSSLLPVRFSSMFSSRFLSFLLGSPLLFCFSSLRLISSFIIILFSLIFFFIFTSGVSLMRNG